MSRDFLFWLAHAVVLVGWIALAFAPLNRPLALRIARIAGALVAIGYVLIFVFLGHGISGLMRDYSLAGIGAVFRDPDVLLLGWVHYLAFDLWVGAWEAEEAERAAIPHALVLPCLLLTCAIGPAGLVAFLAVRALRRRRGARAPG